MEVFVDVTRAGDSVGPASVPVRVALDVTGVDAGVGVAFVGVEAGVGSVVGVSGACVGTGVGAAMAAVGSDVASGAWVLAGNGVVAALGTVVSVGVACWVSVASGVGVTGLGADVAPSTEAWTVATAPPGVGVSSPQASRDARITRIADTAVSVLLPLIRGLTIPPPGLPMLFSAGLAPGLIWYGLVAAVPAQPELLGPLSSLTCRLPSGLPAFGALPSEPFVLLPACERGRFGT